MIDSSDSDMFFDRSSMNHSSPGSFKDFNKSQDIGTSTQLDNDIQRFVNDASTSTPTLSVDKAIQPDTGMYDEQQYPSPKEKQLNIDHFEDAQQTLDDTESNETFDDMRRVDDSSDTIICVSDPDVAKNKEPHPTGIICTRPEYYTKPTLDELINYISEDGTCVVQGFTIGRIGYGNVRFTEAFDISNLNIDELVFFRDKEINIYPNESEKPDLGEGLNRKAQVTLDKVWPYNKKLKVIVSDIPSLIQMDYAERLRKLCEKQGTRFVEYRPETGSWVFKVEHFSKYGHRDSDDDDIEECTDAQKVDKSKPVPQDVLEQKQIASGSAEIPAEQASGSQLSNELSGLSKGDLIASTVEAELLEDHNNDRLEAAMSMNYGLDSSRNYASRAMFHISNFDIGKN